MKRSILIWPDPRLGTVSKSVQASEFETLAPLIQDMWDTVKAARGVGLSAIQIGVPLRVVVLDINGAPEIYINPELAPGASKMEMPEGCLSVPGVTTKTRRSLEVTCWYFNEKGQQNREKFTGLRAQAIQHEVEHLDGKMFINEMTSASRKFIRKEFQKLEKEAQKAGKNLGDYIYGW